MSQSQSSRKFVMKFHRFAYLSTITGLFFLASCASSPEYPSHNALDVTTLSSNLAASINNSTTNTRGVMSVKMDNKPIDIKYVETTTYSDAQIDKSGRVRLVEITNQELLNKPLNLSKTVYLSNIAFSLRDVNKIQVSSMNDLAVFRHGNDAIAGLQTQPTHCIKVTVNDSKTIKVTKTTQTYTALYPLIAPSTSTQGLTYTSLRLVVFQSRDEAVRLAKDLHRLATILQGRAHVDLDL